MVNLLKFKDKASYEDGRETELTGAEAYAIYSRGVMKTLAKVGGKLVFSGEVSRLMLGEVEELLGFRSYRSVSIAGRNVGDDAAARVSGDLGASVGRAGGATEY